MRVLVVDDSRVSRLMSKTFIQHLRPGAEVVEAADARQALALVDSGQAFDLAILDINMPGMNGLELAAELRPRAPSMRIAMLSANFQEANRQRAEQLAVGFFRKPITEVLIGEILGAQEMAA